MMVMVMVMAAKVFMLQCGNDKYDDHFDNDDSWRMQKMWMGSSRGGGGWQGQGQGLLQGSKECTVNCTVYSVHCKL